MIQATQDNLLKEKKTRISFQRVILKRVKPPFISSNSLGNNFTRKQASQPRNREASVYPRMEAPARRRALQIC